jgi:hypothetical protein
MIYSPMALFGWMLRVRRRNTGHPRTYWTIVDEQFGQDTSDIEI